MALKKIIRKKNGKIKMLFDKPIRVKRRKNNAVPQYRIKNIA